MKKNTILIMAIALLTVSSVNAQRRYGPPRNNYRGNQSNSNRYDFYEPRVGIVVGGNITNTVSAYNSNYSTDPLLGFNGGLTFDVPIIYPVSFNPEVLFSQKGYTASTTSGNFTQRTNYIDIPLLAKFKLGPVVNFYIGPQLAFLLSTKNTYDNGFTITSQQYYENTKDKSAIVNGVLGVGFELNRYVELRGRYAIDMGRTRGDAYTPDYRNQVWQVGLGIKFQ